MGKLTFAMFDEAGPLFGLVAINLHQVAHVKQTGGDKCTIYFGGERSVSVSGTLKEVLAALQKSVEDA